MTARKGRLHLVTPKSVQEAVEVSDPSADDNSQALVAFDLRARLRDDAISCVLPPGQRLKLEDLRARYNASIGSLRESLMQLASEGLVVAEANRGFCVASVSLADVDDVTEMRVDLERKAITLAITHGDDQWEANIVAAYHMLAKMAGADGQKIDRRAWNARHNHFHEALVAACPSAWLLRFRDLLFTQSQRYRALSLEQSASPGRIEDHRALMEATVGRDAERAGQLIESHIRTTAENVRNWMANHDGGN